MQNQFRAGYLSYLIILFFTINSTFAQEVTSLLDIPFQQDNEVLQYALVGGLDTPQFAEMDFNNDGIQDLLVFDRLGFVPLTFINGGTPNTVDYTYVPEYQNIFPADLNGWVAPRDYNGDGIMDLFTSPLVSTIDGVAVFRGFYENDLLQFERIRFPAREFDLIYIPLTFSGNTEPYLLYVPALDYPAVDDVDADGDLDILTFNLSGSNIEFYKNISVEEGYGADSLIYRLEEGCWGGIYETDASEETTLSSAPGECATPFTGGGDINFRHAGSTLLTLDYNGDGLKEMILGDLASNNLSLLINGGTTEEAWVIDQVSQFPIDQAVDVNAFPAAFYLDVNNDGVKDLISSSNEVGRGDNYRNVWLYLNNGATNQPDFEFQTETFLVDQMIDVGSDSHPVFVDVNGDELLDILIGNAYLYSHENNRDARIYYYENIGTATEPAFKLITDDWMFFSDFNFTSFDFAPAFGDLDGDGDQDILVGDDEGVLFYRENEGGAGNPMEFNGFTYRYMNLDIGRAARPQIIDINQDGLLDIVIGERGGNNDANGACGTLNYFQNMGTTTEPIFFSISSAPNSSCLGQVFTIPPNEISSYSSPVFWDFGDHVELFVGTDIGGLKRYTDISTDPDTTYTLLSESFLNRKIGNRLSPALADINNDGFLDFLIGNARGGLSFFTTDIKAQFEMPTNTTNIIADRDLKIYPNPAHERLHLSFTEMKYAVERLEIFNVSGQLVHQQKIASLHASIDVSNWNAGIYVVRVFQAEGWVYRKILVG